MKTDWLLEDINGSLPSNFADIYQSGYDFDMRDSSEYWANDKVKSMFADEDGNPNKTKFDNYYKESLKKYNDYNLNDYNITNVSTQKGADTQLIRDIGMEYMKDPVDIKVNRQVKNPFKQTTGYVDINKKSDITQTEAELAQQNTQYWDSSKNEWVQESVQDNLFSSVWDDAFVMSKYDEDIKDENGNIIHRKGEYKLDDKGDFYYETLNGRDTSNKEFLHLTDNLTDEGSFLNKFDFFDTDGIEQTATGSIFRLASRVAPYIAPVVEVPYLIATVGGGLIEAGANLGKAIDGALFNTDKDEQTVFNDILGKVETIFGHSTTKKSQQNILTLENATNFVADILDQLKSQKALAVLPIQAKSMLNNITNKNVWAANKLGKSTLNNLYKSGKITGDLFNNLDPKDYKKMAQLGSNISTMYMASQSAKEINDLSKSIGLDARESGLLYMASLAGFSASMKYLPVDTWVNKGIGYDEHAAVINKAVKSAAPTIQTTLKELTEQGATETVKRNALLKLGKDIGNKITSTFKTLGTDVTKQGAVGVGAGALSESIEEMSEVALQTGIELGYNMISDLGLTNTNKKFKIDPTKLGQDFLMAGVGGAAGGVLFKMFDKIPKIADSSLTELIQQGHTSTILNQIDKLEKKGVFGSKKLSLDVDDTNADGLVYKPTNDEAKSHNKFIADALRREVVKNDNFINKLGVDKETTDKILRGYSSMFNGLIETNTHTSIKDDINETTKEIVDLKNQINYYQEIINNSDDPVDIEENTNLINKLKEDYDLKVEELNDIKSVLQDDQSDKSDYYMRQGLMSLRKDIMSSFGVLTKDNFAEKFNKKYTNLSDNEKLEVDREYNKYLLNDKKKDAKNALNYFESFVSRPDNMNLAKLVEDEQTSKDIAYNNELISVTNEIENLDLNSRIEKFKELETEILNLKDNENLKLSKELKEKVTKLFASINKEVDSKLVNMTSGELSSKYDQIIEKLKEFGASDDIIDEVSEHLQYTLKDESQLRYYGRSPENNLLFDILDEVDIDNDDLYSKVGNDPSPITLESKKIKNLQVSNSNIVTLEETDSYSKFNNGIKNHISFIEEQEELSKDSIKYVDNTGEITKAINIVKEDLDRKMAMFLAMRDVNPVINSWRSNPDINSKLTDRTKSKVEPSINPSTHSNLSIILGTYKKRLDALSEKLDRNTKNISNNIKKETGISFKKQVNELKSAIPSINVSTNVIDTFTNDTIVSSDMEKEMYSQISDFYDNIKSLYESGGKGKKDVENYIESGSTYSSLIRSILKINHKEFYSDLNELVESGVIYAPTYAQERVILELYSFVFSDKDVKHVKNESPDTRLNNIIISLGVPGSGKTQYVLKAVNALIKNKDDQRTTVYYAPGESQLDTISSSIGQDGSKKGGLFKDLISDLGGEFIQESNLESYVEEKKVGNNVYSTINESKLKRKREVNSGKLDDVDVILVDEVTHLDAVNIHYINTLIAQYNKERVNKGLKQIKVVMAGDSSQLGFRTNIKGNNEELNISDLNAEKTTDLDYSLRNGITYTRDFLDSLITKTIVFQKDNDVISKTNPIKVEYYEDEDTLNGIKSGTESDAGILFEKALKNTPEGEKPSFIYITNDPGNVDKLKRIFGNNYDKVEARTPKQVQGLEADFAYVDADADFKDYVLYNAKKFIYTLGSRARKGTIFNESIFKKYDKLPFVFEGRSDKSGVYIILDDDTIKNYKDHKLESYSSFKIEKAPETKDTKTKDTDKSKSKKPSKPTKSVNKPADAATSSSDSTFSNTSLGATDEFKIPEEKKKVTFVEGKLMKGLEEISDHFQISSFYVGEYDIEKVSEYLGLPYNKGIVSDDVLKSINDLKLKALGYTTKTDKYKDLGEPKFRLVSKDASKSEYHRGRGSDPKKSIHNTTDIKYKSKSRHYYIEAVFDNNGEELPITLYALPNIYNLQGAGAGIKNFSEDLWNNIDSLYTELNKKTEKSADGKIIHKEITKDQLDTLANVKDIKIGDFYLHEKGKKVPIDEMKENNPNVWFSDTYLMTPIEKEDESDLRSGVPVIFYSFKDYSDKSQDQLYDLYMEGDNKIGIIYPDSEALPLSEVVSKYSKKLDRDDFIDLNETYLSFYNRKRLLKLIMLTRKDILETDAVTNDAKLEKLVKVRQLDNLLDIAIGKFIDKKYYTYSTNNKDYKLNTVDEIDKFINEIPNHDMISHVKIGSVMSHLNILEQKNDKGIKSSNNSNTANIIKTHSSQLLMMGVTYKGFAYGKLGTPLALLENSKHYKALFPYKVFKSFKVKKTPSTSKYELSNLAEVEDHKSFVTSIDYISLPKIYVSLSKLNDIVLGKTDAAQPVTQNKAAVSPTLSPVPTNVKAKTDTSTVKTTNVESESKSSLKTEKKPDSEYTGKSLFVMYADSFGIAMMAKNDSVFEFKLLKNGEAEIHINKKANDKKIKQSLANIFSLSTTVKYEGNPPTSKSTGIYTVTPGRAVYNKKTGNWEVKDKVVVSFKKEEATEQLKAVSAVNQQEDNSNVVNKETDIDKGSFISTIDEDTLNDFQDQVEEFNEQVKIYNENNNENIEEITSIESTVLNSESNLNALSSRLNEIVQNVNKAELNEDFLNSVNGLLTEIDEIKNNCK